jgi:hypothetical protein
MGLTCKGIALQVAVRVGKGIFMIGLGSYLTSECLMHKHDCFCWECLYAGDITDNLGNICSLEVPVLPGLLPPPTATATVLEVRISSPLRF